MEATASGIEEAERHPEIRTHHAAWLYMSKKFSLLR
jgi:hypothetical protein